MLCSRAVKHLVSASEKDKRTGLFPGAIFAACKRRIVLTKIARIYLEGYSKRQIYLSFTIIPEICLKMYACFQANLLKIEYVKKKNCEN